MPKSVLFFGLAAYITKHETFLASNLTLLHRWLADNCSRGNARGSGSRKWRIGDGIGIPHGQPCSACRYMIRTSCRRCAPRATPGTARRRQRDRPLSYSDSSASIDKFSV